jgi:type VI secretion system secreted protein Hcp
MPVATTPGKSANIDAFLEITDQKGKIKGETLDSQHKGILQIHDFSFGVESAASAATGTGLGAGKAVPKVFEFKVANSTASPILFQYCCNGTHCKEATLFIRKAGGKPQDYYIWKFADLVITKFELACADDIEETVAFTFTKVACEYKPQKADGSLDSGLKGGWDVKGNADWTA